MKLFLLGGRPCSGKTTLADMLGKKHFIDVVHLDEFAQKCILNSTEENPNTHIWKNTKLIELLQNTPEKLLNLYLKTYEEMQSHLQREIDNSDKNALILEGSILLPKFVEDLKKKHEISCCYLLADDDFVRERYYKRDYVLKMLEETNGIQAIKNLLERDSLFSEYINNEIKKYCSPRLMINSEKTIESVLHEFESILGLKSRAQHKT